MSILFRFVIIVAVFVACSGHAWSGDVFRFAFMADGRADVKSASCTDNDSGISPVLGVFVKDILARHAETPMSLLLYPGDLIPGILKRDAPSVAECNRVSLTRWRETVAPLVHAGMAVKVTVGNHEAIAARPGVKVSRCGKHSWPYTPSLEVFTVFKEVLWDMIGGYPGPDGDLGLTYSFNMGGGHFAVLSAYTMFEHNSFSNSTVDWLDKDLTRARLAGLKLFVVAHPPAFPGSGEIWGSLPFYDPHYNCSDYDGQYGIDRRRERDRFWNILKKHGVIAYLCGHEHTIQIQEVEGVWQVVAGGVQVELDPLNGSGREKETNLILYNDKPQNDRASVNWPWNEHRKSLWGWCMLTVEGEKVTLEVFGSDRLPEKPEDVQPLKTFVLRDPKTDSMRKSLGETLLEKGFPPDPP
ncbi:MAG: metallophosphoesterase, partial [Thermodesulfobacteriota bacterium]